MFKKKIILFALLLLFFLALLTFQSIKGEKHFLDFTMYPLEILGKGGTAVANIFSSIPFFKKDDTLERLGRCEEERTRYKEAAYENERLRSLLELKARQPGYVAAAQVFAREPTNWFQVLWINKGFASGVVKDMVAVTPFGLVGKIHRVFSERANVVLISDVNSSVAVRLETSRIEGILEGNGEHACILKYVSKDFEAEVGENVITSGLDGIYPEGIAVGYVSSVDRESGEVFQAIEVTPSQHLNRVEEVAVLKR
ncbi:MAG: rod shape-determining protein MreC [Nitrospiraceae bacterium]|nr:MAG: rod shape-determining protein MreC [Nitrospiraceae bacterium]